MKNKGLWQQRFKENPMEKKFALAWEKENTQSRILEYLLAKNPNYPNNEVTERDATVAATVIQWLGSPCGQNFLKEINE